MITPDHGAFLDLLLVKPRRNGYAGVVLFYVTAG